MAGFYFVIGESEPGLRGDVFQQRQSGHQGGQQTKAPEQPLAIDGLLIVIGGDKAPRNGVGRVVNAAPP